MLFYVIDIVGFLYKFNAVPMVKNNYKNSDSNTELPSMIATSHMPQTK